MYVNPSMYPGRPTTDNVTKPYVKILEQPAPKALRFRHGCEGKTSGVIPGISSTIYYKTYPTIQIMGYKGRSVVVISCVTRDPPYRPHPHNLAGKEFCKKGVCSVPLPIGNMIASFPYLGLECVKKKDIEHSLNVRKSIKVDPFKTGFSHKLQPNSIDLNSIRLCFQVFIEGSVPGKFTRPLKPIVSEPIFDKKATLDLLIHKLSHCSASVVGGQEVMLLCEKVTKEDIAVRFFEEKDGKIIWEAYADFKPINVHKQFAIAFKTPPYGLPVKNNQVVRAFVQLQRPSNGGTSAALPFYLISLDLDPQFMKGRGLRHSTGEYGLKNLINMGALITSTNPHQLAVRQEPLSAHAREPTTESHVYAYYCPPATQPNTPGQLCHEIPVSEITFRDFSPYKLPSTNPHQLEVRQEPLSTHTREQITESHVYAYYCPPATQPNTPGQLCHEIPVSEITFGDFPPCKLPSTNPHQLGVRQESSVLTREPTTESHVYAYNCPPATQPNTSGQLCHEIQVSEITFGDFPPCKLTSTKPHQLGVRQESLTVRTREPTTESHNCPPATQPNTPGQLFHEIQVSEITFGDFPPRKLTRPYPHQFDESTTSFSSLSRSPSPPKYQQQQLGRSGKVESTGQNTYSQARNSHSITGGHDYSYNPLTPAQSVRTESSNSLDLSKPHNNLEVNFSQGQIDSKELVDLQMLERSLTDSFSSIALEDQADQPTHQSTCNTDSFTRLYLQY